MFNNYSKYEEIISCVAPDSAERLGEVFLDWRKQEGLSSVGLLDVCERLIGPPKNEKLRDIVRAALLLADEKNDNAYHNHHHNREVVALTLALLVRHKMNMLEPEISNDMAWLALAGAAIHDYKNDGVSNKVNGIVQPMRTERHSLRCAAPTFLQAGISWKDWHTICMVVLPTDITPTDRPSPSMQLKQVYNACNSKRGGVYHVDPMFVSVLCDPVLATCAQIVSDADLGISAGLNYQISMENCEKLCIETKGAIPWRPSAFKHFLTDICAGFPGSHAGKSLLASGFNHIKCQNERDMHLGISFCVR